MSNAWDLVDNLEGKIEFDNHIQPSEAFEPMSDRDEYLSRLKSKLQKIKGTGREPSTKDILNCLNSAKDDFLYQFHSNESNNSDNQEVEGSAFHGFNISSSSRLLNDFKRCVFPHRSINNPEGSEKLLKCDILAILTERSAKPEDPDFNLAN